MRGIEEPASARTFKLRQSEYRSNAVLHTKRQGDARLSMRLQWTMT